MKESISIDIDPSVGHLDFIGPINESLTISSAASIHSNSSSQLLTGTITIRLAKVMKFKSMAVKLKGLSRVSHYVKITDKSPQYNIGSPLLPKLKTKLISKSAVFPAGEHIIPWELEIPNIYPRSFSATKRGTIQYKVELKIQLGIQKTVTADRSIIIRRHMIPSIDAATLVRSNIYENKTNNFHYELEAPSIICIEQGYLPILIKYNKPLKSVYTQFIQTEIYRCRNITRQEADMGIMASTGENMGNSESGEHGTYKLIKRIQPITLHMIDPEDADHIPLLIRHDLERHILALTPGLESPLIVIQHQVELTFNFGQAHEDFRVQIPVIISSMSGSFPTALAVAAINNKEAAAPMPTAVTAAATTAVERQKYMIEAQLHKLPLSVEILDTTPHKEKVGNSSLSNKSAMGDSTYSFSSMKESSFSFLDDDKGSIKKAISDQNFNQENAISSSKSMIQPRHRSITPPPKLNRNRSTTTTSKPNTIDTQLANRLEASMSMKSPYTPNTINDSTPLNSSTAEAFSGLLPPPRRVRNRKEQSAIDLTLSRSSSTTTSQSSRAVMQSILAVPLPPLPPTNSDNYSDSRPTSPNSTYVAINGYSLSSSSESINTTPPPLSPPPRTPTALVLRKRSNTTATAAAAEDYANRYFGAELPPIPPPMTRQRLPSLPNENGAANDEVVDKEENRKTRMYYEEESDDDTYDYDDLDYSNFYLINERDQ